MAEIERPKAHSAGKGSAYHVLRTQTVAQACQERCRAGQSRDQGYRDRASQPQPMGSNTRQVSGRCWVMGVTPVLCLNPLIGPAYWRGLFFTEDKRGTQNPPSGHFMPIHFTVPADTHISQIPTQRSHLSVSLPKGARRTAQGPRNSQRSYQVTREVSRSADKGLKSHKPTVFRIYR